MKRAVFLDRDGVLVEDVDWLIEESQIRILPGATEAVRRLKEAGFILLVVTNQPVVARGWATEAQIEAIHAAISRLFTQDGGAYLDTAPVGSDEPLSLTLSPRSGERESAIRKGAVSRCAHVGAPAIDRFYFCPHHPHATLPAYRADCQCRKPRPGMILQGAKDFGVDLPASFIVGDRISDIVAGAKAGLRTVLVQTGKHLEPPIQSSDPMNEPVAPDWTCADLAAAAEWILTRP